MSISSTPNDSDMLDYDKIPSIDTESNIGSDEDDRSRKKSRSSIDDEGDYENDDLDESNPRNIWKKRRKMPPMAQSEITSVEQNNLSNSHQTSHPTSLKDDFLRSNSNEFEKYSNSSMLNKRPHDHQVPNFAPRAHDDIMISNRSVKNSIENIFNHIFLCLIEQVLGGIYHRKNNLY